MSEENHRICGAGVGGEALERVEGYNL